MKNYKSLKGIGMYSILGITILYDVIFILIYKFIDSYELSNLMKLALTVYNIYQIYYMLICRTLNYSMDEDNIYINTALGLKKEKIAFESIKAYQKSKGPIKGVKLSGHGKNSFNIGKSFVDKIGTTYMFVTSTKNVIYLNTPNMNYAVSPEKFDEFESGLKNRGIENSSWSADSNKNINFHKDKRFFMLFIITAILALIITLNPIIMYLTDKIPARMPLNFNTDFTPCKFGTGKQFAFKQMAYGLLNMAVLFCMYYAGALFGKYDKKSSYKFIYIALLITLLFLISQFRIIILF